MNTNLHFQFLHVSQTKKNGSDAKSNLSFSFKEEQHPVLTATVVVLLLLNFNRKRSAIYFRRQPLVFLHQSFPEPLQ